MEGEKEEICSKDRVWNWIIKNTVSWGVLPSSLSHESSEGSKDTNAEINIHGKICKAKTE